jgi:tRNA (guanine-N7-)-methyltransferase
LRSFGRRHGRKLTPRQQRLVDEMLPRLRVDPADIAASLPPAETPLWLEIGFGGGEHLVWQAERNPSIRFIGCEPFVDGVAKVLTAIDERALANVRLYDDDARDVLRALPAGSVDRTFILFPDPWPKSRHRKRRLVAEPMLELLARAMKPGAELRLGTDIADYARTMLLALAAVDRFDWIVDGPADWRTRPIDWPETRYERKAHAAGRRCSYLLLRRRDR